MTVESTVLRSACGLSVPLDVDHWRHHADAVETSILADLDGPVLDVGCGPGRIVAALAASGRVAMGVDTSPAASEEANRRGVAVLTRSVFDPLPGERRWRSVVILDGNIGIGGDPVALLIRAKQLLAPGGVVLAEVGAPGSPSDRLTVRVESPHGRGPWFPWARVSADRAARHVIDAGLITGEIHTAGGRWFARAHLPMSAGDDRLLAGDHAVGANTIDH